MEEIEVYLYSVNPKRVIKGLSGAQDIRSPRSLLLTKEDVLKCLPLGSVYRRFAAEGRNERVTIDTVDRFHRANYITEAEWEAMKNTKAEEAPVEAVPVVEEKVEEVVAAPVVEEVAEQAVEEVVEEPVVEEVINETEVVEEKVEDKPEELESSVETEESSTADAAEDLVENVDDAVVCDDEEEKVESAEIVAENESEDSEEDDIESTDSETDEKASTEVQTNNGQQFTYSKKNKHKK